MFVGDVQCDTGAAWILLAYRQYRLPLCYRVTVKISSSPTFDRFPSILQSERHHIITVESMGSDERCFFRIRGFMGIWWYPEKASMKDNISCPAEASTI